MNYKDFDALSSKKKLRIFNELGVPAKSLENIIGFFRKADSEYPDTHTSYEPPTLTTDSFEMEDLLHHHGHLTTKINRLKKIRHTLQKEAKESLVV